MPGAPHARIAADLRRRIGAGEWLPGAALPSRAELAAHYRAPETTVRLAIDALRRTGELEGRRGQRPTVAHPVYVRTLTDPDAPWPHGSETVARGVRRASGDLAARLGVPAGTRVQWERVECWDPGGRPPAMLVTAWRHGPSRPHVAVVCEVRCRGLDAGEAAALGLAAGTAVWVVERTRLDGSGGVVEAADLVLPVDRWRIRFWGLSLIHI